MGEEVKEDTIFEKEKRRIKFLENLIQTMYQKKVIKDEGAGSIDVKLSTKELKDLISAENELMKMKRRSIGLPS